MKRTQNIFHTERFRHTHKPTRVRNICTTIAQRNREKKHDNQIGGNKLFSDKI